MANKFIVTDAGLQELADAVSAGTTVQLTQVKLGNGKYTASASQTAMKGTVLKTLDAINGGNVGDNIIHIEIADSSSDSYVAYEVGVFSESGTLFGIVSSATAILEKASSSNAILAIDFVLASDVSQAVTVSGVTYYVPPATTELQGIAELATSSETIAGTDTSRVVTPAGLASLTATDARRGLTEYATSAETIAGTSGQLAVTPYGLSTLTSTTERRGLMEMATDAEFNQATDTERAVNPAQVKTAINVHEAKVASKTVLGHVMVGNGLSIDASGLLSLVFDSIYPVGSVYSSVSSSFNPNTSFGGTWEKIAEGTALISAGDTYSVGNQYGSNTANLVVANLPAHSHTATTDTQGTHSHNRGDMNIWGKFASSRWSGNCDGAFTNNGYTGGQPDKSGNGGYDFNANRNWSGSTGSTGGHTHKVTVADTGSGQSFSIMQRSIAVFFWKRTA